MPSSIPRLFTNENVTCLYKNKERDLTLFIQHAYGIFDGEKVITMKT